MTESTMQTKNSGPPPPPTPEQEPDPLQYQYDQFVHMNRQAKINLGIMLLVAFAVLYKFTTINAHMMRGWTAEEIAYRIPVDNWLSYSAILDEAPVQTKAVTSATVYTIGDLIAQRTEGKAMGELDRLRTVRSMAAGLLAHGPMSHYWYEWSESVFENVFHWTQW
jgi:protein Mpv17